MIETTGFLLAKDLYFDRKPQGGCNLVWWVQSEHKLHFHLLFSDQTINSDVIINFNQFAAKTSIVWTRTSKTGIEIKTAAAGQPSRQKVTVEFFANSGTLCVRLLRPLSVDVLPNPFIVSIVIEDNRSSVNCPSQRS